LILYEIYSFSGTKQPTKPNQTNNSMTNTRVSIPKSSMNPLLRGLNGLLEAKIGELMAASTAGEDGSHTFTEEQIRDMIPSTAEFGLLMKPERASKSRKTKDPHKPKKPKTAYLIFTHSDETKLAFKEANPELWDAEKERPTKITELTKWASVQWKALDEGAQAPYKAKQAELSAEYQEKMADYQPSQVVIDEDDVPDAPSDWSGPFNGFYLWKNVEGKKTYKTFQEAIEAAESNEEALGVTKTPSGVYSVRKGEGGQPYPSSKGEVSWMKGEATITTVTPVAPKTKMNKANSLTSSGDDATLDHSINPSTEDNEVYDQTTEEEFDPENDDGEENDGFDPTAEEEEEDEEGADVVRWTHEGTEYLVNNDNGDIYDAVKYENEAVIVKIGVREPNTEEGSIVTE